MQKIINIRFNIGDRCFRYDEENEIIAREEITGIVVKKRMVYYKTDYCNQEECGCVLFESGKDCFDIVQAKLTSKYKNLILTAQNGIYK